MRVERRALVGAVVVLSLVAAGCSEGETGATVTTAPVESSLPREPTPTDAAVTTSLDEELEPVSFDPLPPPIDLGSADDPVAAVAAGLDAEQPAAALTAALLASGIPVLDDFGQPLDPAVSGVAVQPWEVLLYAEAAGAHGAGMSLADLGDVLAGALAVDLELDGAELAGLMLDDVRRAASDEDPHVAAWGSIVSELGRRQDPPSDWSTATDPASIHVEPTQLLLILRMLVDDLVADAAVGASGGGGAGGEGGQPGPVRRPSTELQVAPMGAADAPGPCIFSRNEELIVRAGEEGLAFGFKQFLKYLGAKGVEGAKKISGKLGLGQVIADYARLAIAFLSLTSDFTISETPLVRTKEVRPRTGERATIAATIRYDLGKAQILHCFRLLLAHVGIKARLPQTGVIKGASVNWVGLVGFDVRTDRIVQFVGGNPADNPTDDNGITRLDVEGFGQESKLPEEVRPVRKTATVRLLVQLQDADFLEDLLAATSAATFQIDEETKELKPKDPLSFLKIPADLLRRTRWLAPQRFDFAVQDWGINALTLRFESVLKGESPGQSGPAQQTHTETVEVPLTLSGLGEISGTATGLYVNDIVATCERHISAPLDLMVTGTLVETATGAIVLRLDLSGLTGDPEETTTCGSKLDARIGDSFDVSVEIPLNGSFEGSVSIPRTRAIFSGTMEIAVTRD